MARVTRKQTEGKALVGKLIADREARAEYEANHSLESTVVMAFDTMRNTMGTINNVATICRNKSEIKVVESHRELHDAYQSLLA